MSFFIIYTEVMSKKLTISWFSSIKKLCIFKKYKHTLKKEQIW